MHPHCTGTSGARPVSRRPRRRIRWTWRGVAVTGWVDAALPERALYLLHDEARVMAEQDAHGVTLIAEHAARGGDRFHQEDLSGLAYGADDRVLDGMVGELHIDGHTMRVVMHQDGMAWHRPIMLWYVEVLP